MYTDLNSDSEQKKNQFRLITWRCGKISVRSSGARRFSFQASNFFKTSLAQWTRVQASHSVTKSFTTTRMQWPRARKTCELPVLKTTWNTSFFRRDKFLLNGCIVCLRCVNLYRLIFIAVYRPLSIVKPVRKKKATKTRVKSTTVNFPVDFFEHCQPLNEVEFGGGDILQVYNVQQVKHRLMTAGMYIASTKVCLFLVFNCVLLGSPSWCLPFLGLPVAKPNWKMTFVICAAKRENGERIKSPVPPWSLICFSNSRNRVTINIRLLQLSTISS